MNKKGQQSCCPFYINKIDFAAKPVAPPARAITFVRVPQISYNGNTFPPILPVIEKALAPPGTRA
jgi:hypothetical protein